MVFGTLQASEAQWVKDAHATVCHRVYPEGVYLAGLKAKGLAVEAILSVCFILSTENCPFQDSTQVKCAWSQLLLWQSKYVH